VKRFGLLNLRIVFQTGVPPKNLSPDVFLDKLDAEQDQLLKEVNDQSLAHLASKGYGLGLSLDGI
jgi:hypothetical protein